MKAENGKDDGRGILCGSDGLLTLTESQWQKVRELEIRVITLASKNFATTDVLPQLLERNQEGCLQRLNVLLLLIETVDRVLKLPLQTMTRDYVQQLVTEQFRNWNRNSQLFESWTRSGDAAQKDANELQQINDRLDGLLEQLAEDVKTMRAIERRSVPCKTLQQIVPLLKTSDLAHRAWAVKTLESLAGGKR